VKAVSNGSFPPGGGTIGRELEEAARSRPAGSAPDAALRALQDRATREAIDLQVQAGLDIVSDGLLRHPDPIVAAAGGLGGIRFGEGRAPCPGRGVPCAVPVVEAEISWNGPLMTEDYLFAAQGAGRPVKPILVGPFTLAIAAEDHAYGDPMSTALGFAAALNRELRSLAGAGASIIQIDEPGLLAHKDQFPLFTRIWEVLGRGVGATLALHLDGGDLEGIYPGVTQLKRLGALGIDLIAGARTADLIAATPWPAGLTAVLGVVDGRSARVETAEEIRDRVRSLRGFPDGAAIDLGPAAGLGGLPAEVAFAKARNLAAALPPAS
jgi:5-methyltetrahydropteroyltriglutamate--homocysteine methyltransferase